MAISPNTDSASILEGTRFLVRRPWTVLGLSLLGMALSALAPLLQMRAGLPDDIMVSSAVIFAALFPLELYFIPRFLMEADAEAGGNPLNALTDWKVRFEERWLKAFVAKALLGILSGVGLALMVLPGLLVLLAFGWVPMRVLLKGEPLLVAARGSLAMMAASWRRMVLAALTLGLIYLLLATLVGYLVGLACPEPTLWQRMASPAAAAGNFAASLLSIWLSACLLALYRRLDQPAPGAKNQENAK